MLCLNPSNSRLLTIGVIKLCPLCKEGNWVTHQEIKTGRNLPEIISVEFALIR